MAFIPAAPVTSTSFTFKSDHRSLSSLSTRPIRNSNSHHTFENYNAKYNHNPVRLTVNAVDSSAGGRISVSRRRRLHDFAANLPYMQQSPSSSLSNVKKIQLLKQQQQQPVAIKSSVHASPIQSVTEIRTRLLERYQQRQLLYSQSQILAQSVWAENLKQLGKSTSTKKVTATTTTPPVTNTSDSTPATTTIENEVNNTISSPAVVQADSSKQTIEAISTVDLSSSTNDASPTTQTKTVASSPAVVDEAPAVQEASDATKVETPNITVDEGPVTTLKEQAPIVQEPSTTEDSVSTPVATASTEAPPSGDLSTVKGLYAPPGAKQNETKAVDQSTSAASVNASAGVSELYSAPSAPSVDTSSTSEVFQTAPDNSLSNSVSELYSPAVETKVTETASSTVEEVESKETEGIVEGRDVIGDVMDKLDDIGEDAIAELDDAEKKPLGQALLEVITEGVPGKIEDQKQGDFVEKKGEEETADKSQLIYLVDTGKVKNLTVSKLKRLLSAHNLKTSGRKGELIARLTSYAKS